MKGRGWLLVLGAVVLILTGGSALYGFILKEGVSGQLQPVMTPALDAVRQVWQSRGLGAPVITSIQDGQHGDGSLHPMGLAFDIRLNDIPAALHETLRAEVAALAGDAFDAVHEYHGQPRDHLHLEFDPV